MADGPADDNEASAEDDDGGNADATGPQYETGDGGNADGWTGEDGDGGFSLRLPPIRLPPLFPEDFRVLWPSPGEKLHGRVTHRVVAVALVAFDLVDAALAVTVDSAVLAGVRVVGGALLAATTFGTAGVLYVWEAAAVLAGVGELTAVPTLTALLVAGLVRELV